MMFNIKFTFSDQVNANRLQVCTCKYFHSSSGCFSTAMELHTKANTCYQSITCIQHLRSYNTTDITVNSWRAHPCYNYSRQSQTCSYTTTNSLNRGESSWNQSVHYRGNWLYTEMYGRRNIKNSQNWIHWLSRIAFQVLFAEQLTHCLLSRQKELQVFARRRNCPFQHLEQLLLQEVQFPSFQAERLSSWAEKNTHHHHCCRFHCADV